MFTESTMWKDYHDDWYCEECRDCLSTCDSCGNVYDSQNEGTFTEDERNYCEDCESETTWTCEDCETCYSEETENYGVEGGNRIVCEGCYNENYFTCESCSQSYHRDNEHYCEDCDVSYCDNCYDDHSCNGSEDSETDEERRSHRFEARNPEGIFKGDKKGKYLKVDRLIGVEIGAVS